MFRFLFLLLFEVSVSLQAHLHFPPAGRTPKAIGDEWRVFADLWREETQMCFLFILFRQAEE